MTIRKRGASYEVRIIRKKILQKLGIVTGIYPFTITTSHTDAKRQHDAFCHDLDNGIIPKAILDYAKTFTSDDAMTVGNMYRIMLTDPYYHASESVTKLITSIYEQIEHIVLVDYDRPTLLEWINDMKLLKNAPSTIRKKVGALRTIFVYAVTCENPPLTSNVFDSLPKGYSLYKNHKNRLDTTVKRDKIRDRRLNVGEEDLIIQAINQYRLDPRRDSIGEKFKPALQIMFTMAIDTAMRLQELYLLQWNHIDFDNGIINIPANTTKANKFRQVPMTKALLPQLKDYKEKYSSSDSGHVLPFFAYYECSRKKCSVSLSHMWARIFKQAEIKGLRFHDLRHEGVSRMVELTTLTLTQLQKISGHADSRTFDRYNNLRTENITANFY